MRKQITAPSPDSIPLQHANWLDLDPIAQVEVTSEEAGHPVESALMPGVAGPGWRAATAGEQTLRIHFDTPRNIRRIRLVFTENDRARTQEFLLAWSSDGVAYHDVVRQQYNFSPNTTEVEEYEANLTGVRSLRLKIIPEIGGGSAIASLAELRVA